MVVGLLKTVAGVLLLSLVFSLPLIGAYLTYELAWPRLARYVRGPGSGGGS